MKAQFRLFALVAVVFCALLFAGCVQNDETSLLTAPGLEGPPVGTASLGLDRESSGLTDPDAPQMVVTDVFGPEGGVIEAGRVSVSFPSGSLPPGVTRITLMVWEVGDAYYFTLEPRNLPLLRPVDFRFKLDPGTRGNLSYHWNDGGWREPMPSWLSDDHRYLIAETTFLGEFVVAPKFKGRGRAGW